MPEDTTTQEVKSAPLVGIGGWLLFFIIRLLLVVAGDGLQLLSGTFSWPVKGITIALAVLATVTIVLLITGQKAGVLAGKLSMLADAALALFGAIGGFIGGSDKAGKAFAVCLADVAWFFYLSQSVRVKNTYFSPVEPQ